MIDEINGKNKVSVSIIIPSYLEEENLRILIPRIKRRLERYTSDYEIIVVDTLTPLDGTKDVCLKNEVSYINRIPTNSYGDAVRSGIQKAKGEKILFMDADGSHPPYFITKILENIEAADVIVASRYIEGGFTENSRVLIWMSQIVNWGYRKVLNIKIKDISNSFKLYPSDKLRSLTLASSNFDIIEEIIFKMIKYYPDTTFLEIPFSFKKRMFGKTKRNLILFIFTYLLTLVKLRFGK